MPDDLKHPHLAGAYADMAARSAVPLWEIYDKLVSDRPQRYGDPHLWRYDDMRALLMSAGSSITAAEAERRVLALKNPGLERPGIAQTLFAGLQLVMPGEIAPAHRHTQGAIRLVLESSGGYTAVQGERCEMRRGDFITTPSWCWHDHENTGDGPMIWLDGLDVPLVNFFGAKFAEENEHDQQEILRGDDDSVTRWGSGMRPMGAVHAHPYSPIYSYPYERARAGLAAMEASDDPDPHHAFKLVYGNPQNGGHVLPTIAATLQRLPAGFETAPRRGTEAQVFAVIEGEGTASIDGVELAFGPSDVFVAPNWSRASLRSAKGAVVFAFSDRAAQERLGIWREDLS